MVVILSPFPVAWACTDDDARPATPLPEVGDSADLTETVAPADGVDDRVEPDAAETTAEDIAPELSETLEVVIEPGPVRPTPEVTWTPCPELFGEPNDRTECATVVVPLSTRDLRQRTVELFVKRMRARVPESPPRAVWLLMGGPGQAGSDGENIALMIDQRDPGVDVYLPDHRGVGKSSRLYCRVQESPQSLGGENIEPGEWPACREAMVEQWDDGLAYFSTTESAYDLESLVRAVHPPADRVSLLGISYGTYLALRYLQIFPDGAGVDAVTLDSLCSPGKCKLSEQDMWEDEVAHQLLDLCAGDPDCSRYYPPDGDSAWQSLGELYKAIEGGHCPLTEDPALDVELLRAHLGMLNFNYGGRRLVPALIRRYHRCAPEDVEAIRHNYVTNLGFDPTAFAAMPLPQLAYQAQALQGYSFPLAINILVSELWEASNPSPDELIARWEKTRSCRGVSRNAAFQTPGWPRYDEPRQDEWPDFRIPILAMNADYAPATPAEFARPIAARLTGPHQRYVELPGHGHTVIAQGQLVSDTTTTCGRELFLQFLRDPEAELDESCIADSLKMQFKMRPQASMYWFGTTDLWGDEVVVPQ